MDHTDLYDQLADTYRDTWDDYTTPDLAAFAEQVDGTILDAGCGPGRDLAAFTRCGAHAVGIDASAAMVDVAVARGAAAAVADMCHLPMRDATFAGVWVAASLVHLDDDTAAAALRELRRVTRPGGLAHLSVKGNAGRDTPGGDDGTGRWFRWWGADEFAALVTANGWAVTTNTVTADSRRPDVTWVTITATAS